MSNEDDRHEIRLPGSILEQIKGKEAKGDYTDGSRYESQTSRKRKQSQQISRKDKRKEERQQKKQKKGPTSSKNSHSIKNESKIKPKPTTSHSKAEENYANEEDTWAQLKKLKQKKKDVGKKTVSFETSTENHEESENSEDFDDFDDFSDFDDFEGLDDDEITDGDFDDEIQDDEMSAESTMAALKALKDKKNKNKNKNPESSEDVMAALKAAKEMKNKTIDANVKTKKVESKKVVDSAEDVMAALRAAKEKKIKKAAESADDVMALLKAAKEKKSKTSEKVSKKESKKESTKSKKESEKEKTSRAPLSAHERELMRRDEEDMAFYAKKLGMKKGAKLAKTDDDDILGGLLDGLDFDFTSDREDDEESEDENDEEIAENLPFSSDDEINSSDFDEDMDEEDLEGDIGDSEDDDGDEEEEEVKPKRENPFVAPVAEGSAGRYVPPALRRQMGSQAETEEQIKLKRAIKGPLNRLSEANVANIVNEINGLYSENPRQLVNESLTNIVLESIVQQGRLLDTFVILHASLISSIYRLQGVEFGAYFIQTLVEQLELAHQNSSGTEGKKASNLVSLLVACYSFQVISCKLLYDLIRTLISEITEENTELLLRLIRNAGNQMRSDDPGALKEIIVQLQTTVSKMGKEANTRTKFLIETIVSLKNNKMKAANEQSHLLVIRMKKFLGNMNNNKFNDPIHVSLDDIHNIKTKGKWWLVGSAWKGNDSDIQKSDEQEVNADVMNDILDNAEPNWMELARAQRMNTDIRRAIFISIMSANDFVDASDKLDKLGLKRSQEREIPRVLLHCTGVEPAWNPYYGILASKLCDNHSLRKTFQFVLWDLLKEFEGDDADEDALDFDTNFEDEETKLRKILNLGRLYGFLVAQGSLALNVLRTVNFLTASNDTVIFMEVLMVTFFDIIGKKCEINSVGGGLKPKKSKMFDIKYDDKPLIEKLLKTQEQTSLLRGLAYFLQEKVKVSDVVNGKKQKRRVDWGVDATCDIIDEFLKSSE